MATREQSQSANEPVPQMPQQVSIGRVANYDVFDSGNNRIGSTTALWMDRNNQPAFIGVKTGWLMGKTHVIPAWGAEVNHKTERIRLGCPGEVVRDAPSFSPDEELDGEKERQIMSYFQAKGACQQPAGYKRDVTGAEFPREQTQSVETENRQSAEQTNIPLHEEKMNVGKRSVEAGGVRLRKIIRTETVQEPVELKREEIQIERVPASGQRTSEKAFEQQDVYIPLRREEAVVQKEARVREEVRARKGTSTEKQTVSGEVRREDVEVEHDRDQDRRKAA